MLNTNVQWSDDDESNSFPPEEEEELMDLEDRLDMLLEQADEM